MTTATNTTTLENAVKSSPSTLSTLWKMAGSINLSIILLLLLTLDSLVGYFCLDRNPSLFRPMGDMGLMTWIDTYGRHNLAVTGWFFVLLALLFVLCCNTFVCTTDRTLRILRNRKQHSTARLLFRLAPHCMHYALLLILTGYLCSYLFSIVIPTQTLVIGSEYILPNQAGTIRFISFDPVTYNGERLYWLDGNVLSPKATLRLSTPHTEQEAVIGFNRPARFNGYSLHLKNFEPKTQGKMHRKTRIDLHVRKDPGVMLYLAGLILFSFGMVLYGCEWIFFREVSKK
ncbi:hypothetical protein [Desulfogranum japonicum]|uniref:hypothetical protein n=1 Tax=Desulfogranum japonicum TaxID=231447 RepID=UPI0003FC7599|nr:hypothetical protein [Desulfogranum japonicum]